MTKDLTLADELERLAKEATPGGVGRAQHKAMLLVGVVLENLPAILSALRGEQWQGIEAMRINLRLPK